MKHFRVCDSDKVHVINAYIQGVFFNLVILIVRRFRGGASRGILGGNQSRKIFRGEPVKKKTPCSTGYGCDICPTLNR